MHEACNVLLPSDMQTRLHTRRFYVTILVITKKLFRDVLPSGEYTFANILHFPHPQFGDKDANPTEKSCRSIFSATERRKVPQNDIR